MARPRKTGLDYFSHDVDLSSDDKIEAIEGRYGPTGYAFYCKTLERIYRHGTPINYPGVFRSIMSGKLRITPEELDSMIQFSVQIDLLSREPDGAIMSEGARKRLKFIDEGREFDRKRVIDRKTTGKLPENPIKESKVKEIKEEKSKRDALPRFTPPTLIQISDYCRSRGNTLDPEKFLAHYESNGWKVGRNQMKSWQAAIITWEKGNKNAVNGKHPQQFESAQQRKDRRIREEVARWKSKGGGSTLPDFQDVHVVSEGITGSGHLGLRGPDSP